MVKTENRNWKAEHGDGTPMLSVCVVGRNEEHNIQRVMESLTPLRSAIDDVEIIYVDSDSSDASVQCALNTADEVLVLESSRNLCASAGRYVGTLRARGRWVLYLDADMSLQPEFIPFLIALVESDDVSSGWVGERRDVYPSGEDRPNVLGLRDRGATTSGFGGAVVLPLESVIRAGNWNPRLFSNEEIDLYTRLRATDCVVRSVGVPMIDHYASNSTRREKLKGLFLGGETIGKKYYGIGQVLAARRHTGGYISLVRFFPHPFVFWGSILASTALWLLGLRRAAIVALLSGTAYVWRKKGLQFLAVYTAFAPQAALGYGRYDSKYIPRFRSIRSRGGGI